MWAKRLLHAILFASAVCSCTCQELESAKTEIDPTCDQSLTAPSAAKLIAEAGLGHLETVQGILDQGLHPDSLDPEDPDWESALMRAASNDHHHVLKLLLDRGADRYHQDWEGRTALMIAATLGRKNALRELLLERPREFDGSTAVALGGPEGRYAEMRDKKGRTALLWACYNGKSDTTEMLIAHGVNLDAADDTGRTPLMWAATSLSAQGLEAARALLEAGADANAEDEAGATALTWAVERGNRALLTLVAKYQFGPDTELM